MAGGGGGGGGRDESARIIKMLQLLQKPTSGFYELPGKHDLEKTRCV